MSSLILGTAGHIDHGKTALIKALTGVDTDRLKQEKERGISIELGFAGLDLAGDIHLGIVDVPGHEKLVRTMVAGATGMDMVMLVVAADDGIMPQTEEHLAIIDLLGVRRGVVVISKADLVEPDWLELVAEDVRKALAGSSLEEAPVLAVSARTGQGVNALRDVLERLAAGIDEGAATGPFRLPIDRVFSMVGAGTVVTGTAWQGSLNLDDKVSILPKGPESKVRNLQVHGEKVSQAKAGERVAVNVGGLAVSQIRRGQWLTGPGFEATGSNRLFVRLRLLPGDKPLKNRAAIRFHHGTDEVIGRVNLPDREELEPGGVANAIIRLERPVLTVRGDGYIIRQYSPLRTLGGGRVLLPGLASTRRRDELRDRIAESLAEGDDAAAVGIAIEASPMPLDRARLSALSGLWGEALTNALAGCRESYRTMSIEGREWYFKLGEVKRYRQILVDYLASFHKKDKSAVGLDREALRAAVARRLDESFFNQVLNIAVAEKQLVRETGTYSHPSAGRSAQDADKELQAGILASLDEAAFQTPSESELLRQLGVALPALRRALSKLVAENSVVRVGGELLFTANRIAEAEELIRQTITAEGGLTPARFRELVNTSRKYAVPLLEHFDAKGLTVRRGDTRELA